MCCFNQLFNKREKMLATEGGCQELVIRPNLEKPTAFQKAAARFTIISVLSRKVNTKPAVLRNDSVPLRFPEIQAFAPKEVSTMSSANFLPSQCDGHLASVDERSNENIEDKNGETKDHNGINGDVADGLKHGKCGNQETSHSGKDSKVSKKVTNDQEKQSDPFDYMKERKLSEPVLSPRKRINVMTPKLTRCRSTVDVRDNEKPKVLRELGGYKFFAKPSDTTESTSSRKTYNNRVNENKNTNEVSALKKIIAEQKENITNREKHLLHLEKKLALLEHENSKNRKQISNFREKLKDCSGTVDYLRREKETLASERDRLSFTLLTCEHELNELRAQNTNLVTEYESAEHSRKIAVGHLQEVERVCHESHQEKPDPTQKRTAEKSSKILEEKSEKKITQLNLMKEAVEKLRIEREALQNEHKKLSSFFAENLKKVADKVRDIKSKLKEVPGNSLCTVSENSIHEVISSVNVTSAQDVFLEPDEAATVSEDVSELDAFKGKLGFNEQSIDEVANQIRDLENRKKSLLEARFAMIQEFQAGGEVPEDWDTDKSSTDVEEKVESETGGGDRKRSRVTKKIRKLERTLSMDHGVGKLDCIQKLCKKLEECEQRIHELEATNSELRAEHEDMEEEAKYLKYVLSYRGDVMKAQMQNEFETKMAAMKDELAKCKKSQTSRSEVAALTKRNNALEEEVRRLHEELSTLLENLPALQAVKRTSSTNSEYNISTSDISTNFADVSSNLDNSKAGEDISGHADNVSGNINLYGTAESGDGLDVAGAKSQNDNSNSNNDGDSSQNPDGGNSQNPDGETKQSLEEKVIQLAEEKRVLLLSMQTLTSQWATRADCSESDSSFSRNVTALEANLHEVEQENAFLSETLQRIRNVLEEEHEHENNSEQADKILKLKQELQHLDTKVKVCGSRNCTIDQDIARANAVCARHEARISELEMEIYRLHEEKKSLLSSIVRVQTDPNFTLSDDVNESSVTNTSDVMLDDVTNGSVTDVVDAVQRPSMMDNVVDYGGGAGYDDLGRIHNPLVKTVSRDEEVQVNMSREDIYGLLGYLQRDLDKLRTALDQDGIARSKAEKDGINDPNSCSRQNSVEEVQQLNKELKDLGHHTHVLEERLQESESIRCDLHRTISIATDMATEERQKCEELTRTKTALEKEMLKLAKENRDLREGLETLSRARKRRNSRPFRASPSSDTHEDEECRVMYLPRVKAQNFSESEFSDMDSPVVESKSFSRTT